MSLGRYEIIWSRQALAALYKLPPHTAMVVDRAVIRFVERGEGVVESVLPYHRLRAGFYDVMLSIDHAGRTVGVMQLYRARAR